MKSCLEQNTKCEWWVGGRIENARWSKVLNEREWGLVWWKAIYAWKIQIEFFHSMWMPLLCVHIRCGWECGYRWWMLNFHNTSKLQLIQLWRLSYWCIKLFLFFRLCCYFCCHPLLLQKVNKRINEREHKHFLM